MRLSEYLEVGKKMKTARTNAGISHRETVDCFRRSEWKKRVEIG